MHAILSKVHVWEIVDARPAGRECAKMASLPPEFFHDPDERVISVLGEGYVDLFVTCGRVDRSFMVLTDRRLYQEGTRYESMPAGGFRPKRSKCVVDTGDITGARFLNQNLKHMFRSGILFIVLGMILCTAAYGRSNFMFFIGAASCFMGVCSITAHFTRRARFFVVEYSGGQIAMPCDWYRPGEIEEFQRSISQAKRPVTSL